MLAVLSAKANTKPLSPTDTLYVEQLVIAGSEFHDVAENGESDTARGPGKLLNFENERSLYGKFVTMTSLPRPALLTCTSPPAPLFTMTLKTALLNLG